MSAPMFLLAGAPGAGKSTFANRLRGTESAFIFETDNFFVDSIDKRTYHFNPELLSVAHAWNQGEVIRACRDCPDIPVIVANTFTRIEEFYPYREIAKTFGRKMCIFRLLTEHDNVHNVPEETVAKMRRAIRSLTSEQVRSLLRNTYTDVYCLDIQNDADARIMAQTAHIKYFQRR